ncbi:MAG: hypothetical protein V4447_03605 [Pseudomonadota bacterium]
MRLQTNLKRFRFAVFSLTLAIAFFLFALWMLQKENLSPKKNVSPNIARGANTEALKDKLQDPNRFATRPAPKPAQLRVFDDSFCEDIAQEMKSEKSKPALKNKLEEHYKNAAKELELKLSQYRQYQFPQDQAAALYLKAQLQANNARSNFFRQHPDCDSGKACEGQAVEARNLAKRDGVNEVAKLAIYSPDPQLYAMAFHACNSITDNQFGFCKQISASQWAQRDPENATAWLHTVTQLAQTSKGKTNTEMDTAMFRLSQTNRFDLGLSSLSLFQRSEQMQSENIFVRQNLIMLGMDVFMGESLPAYQHILSYCTNDALQDSNRRQVCNGIANNLLSDQSNLVGETIALKLAERLAWPPEKIANLREELDAIHELQESVFDDLLPQQKTDHATQALQSCKWLVKNTNDLENRLQYGEMREIRSRMSKQKISRAELAARYRASKK